MTEKKKVKDGEPTKKVKIPKAAEPVEVVDMERLKKMNPKKYTKLMIESEPKVTMMIPLEQGEKPGASHTFQINGVKFTYPKSTMVELPESIAEMVKQRWSVGFLSHKDNLRNASPEKLKALS